MSKKEAPQVEGQPVKKRKKHHIFLWVLLGFFSVIVISAGVLVGLAYDKTSNTTEYQEKTIQEVGTKAFINGLHSLTNNGEIRVGISKNDINGLLLNIQKEQLANVSEIEKMYILMESNTKATFYVEAKVTILESRLSIETELFDDTENNSLGLRIHRVKLGKLPLDKNLARNIFLLVGLDDGSGMKKVGDFLFNFKNWEISLSKDALFNAIRNNVGEGLVNDILNTIQQNNLVNFDVDTPNLVEMVINLNKLKQNEQYLTNDDNHLIINQEDSVFQQIGVDEIHATIGGRMKKIVDNATNLQANQLQDLFQYLFNGYERSSEQTRNVIHNIDSNNLGLFRSVGIPDVTKYSSYGNYLKSDAGSLLGNAKAQINQGSLDSNGVCRIYESDLNKFLRGQGVIGNCGVINFTVNNKLEYAFFVVDNFYANLFRTIEGDETLDHLSFVVGINISGFETYIILDTVKIQNNTDGRVYFGLNKLYFGEIDATELLAKTVFDMLEKNIPVGEMIGVVNNSTDRRIYFSLSEVVDRIKEFPGFSKTTVRDIAVDVLGTSVQDEGYLEVTI